MADKDDKYPENKTGKFYVDRSCIACDTCVMHSPDNFEISSEDGHAYIQKQPENEEEIDKCEEALEDCPVGAIGDDGEE